MASDDPTPGRCNAITRTGGHCEKYPLEGASRCRFHGGASTGPQDASALEENEHAAGNPGGGAPALNMNAAIAGAHADLDLLEARLEGAARTRYEELKACYIEDAQCPLPDAEIEAKAREAALLSIREWRGHRDVFERGVALSREMEYDDRTVTVTRVNPALAAGLRDSTRQLELLHELGILPVG